MLLCLFWDDFVEVSCFAAVWAHACVCLLFVFCACMCIFVLCLLCAFFCVYEGMFIVRVRGFSRRRGPLPCCYVLLFAAIFFSSRTAAYLNRSTLYLLGRSAAVALLYLNTSLAWRGLTMTYDLTSCGLTASSTGASCIVLGVLSLTRRDVD